MAVPPTAASQDYREVAALARQRRDNAIPKEYLLPAERLAKLPQDYSTLSQDLSIYSHDEIQIINAGVGEILQKLHDKIWTSVEVTKAFCKSATIANQLTNCITEVLFAEALLQAQALDDHLARTGKPIGPLHGLPISLKDNFVTPPHPASIGMAAYANVNTPPERESVLVTMLRDLGAVLYVKTNVPTAMMMMETDNNVWGQTINGRHRGCNAGGSSGGECALVAMRGSPLGIGTDIGGSIRIPSAFQGLFGLKPSFGRYPQWGGQSGIPGNEFILAINGPISRDVESLRVYSEAVLSSLPAASPWKKDPKALPLPWQSTAQIEPAGRPLRIAFIGPADGLVTAHPPIDRALHLTKAALRAAGHEVLDWPDVEIAHPPMVKTLLAAFFDFGGKPIMDLLRPFDEPIFAAMKPYELASEAAGGSEQPLTATRVREMNQSRNAMQKAYLDAWHGTGDLSRGVAPIDAIVAPSSPWAAVRNGFTNKGPAGQAYFGYTGVWNLLDMPVCTFPVTKVDKALDTVRDPATWTPLGELDATIQADYDPAFYHGAPVALQCVGERLGEEKVLAVVERIVEALHAQDVRFE